MKKLYYSIGEVSEITSVEPHVLRYWESIFDELSPKKNKAGNRIYKEQDITVVLELKELIQNRKYSTAGAKRVLRRDPGPSVQSLPSEVQRDLKEIRIFLDKLAQHL